MDAADPAVGGPAGRRHWIRALGVGACRHRRGGAKPPGARVRRHRCERVHRRRHARRGGALHLRGRHAVPVGVEHLVSHAERRVPHADQRRDRFPVHHRRSGRARTHVCAPSWPLVRRAARRRPPRRHVRVRRARAPAGLRRERHTGRQRRWHRAAPRGRTGDRHRHGRGRSRRRAAPRAELRLERAAATRR